MHDPPSQPDRVQRWLRISGLLIGFLFLIWLPFEDVAILYTLLLALGLGAWGMLRFVLKKNFNQIRWAATGVVAGLLVPPLVLALMAIKSSLHAHGFSDFALPQIQTVLWGTPWFALAGLLFGIGVFQISRLV